MTYLSQRRRVQHLVVIGAVETLVHDIRHCDGHEVFVRDRCDEIERHLRTARAEVQDRDPAKARRVARTAQRAQEATFHPLLGVDFGALIIAVRHLIEGLIHEGWLTVNEGGAFDTAWGLLIDMIARSPEYDAIDSPERRSQATALVRLMRRQLAEHGLFVAREAAA